MAEEEGPLYIHYVQVRHALAAIKKYAEKRTAEIGQNAHLLLEGMEPEKECIIQSMKNLQLKEGETVSLDKFQTLLTYEQKLYDLYAKSLELTVKEMTEELEKMVADSLQFYKVKFWDPKHEKAEPSQKSRFQVWKPTVMAVYVLLTIIPISVYYVTKSNMLI